MNKPLRNFSSIFCIIIGTLTSCARGHQMSQTLDQDKLSIFAITLLALVNNCHSIYPTEVIDSKNDKILFKRKSGSNVTYALG